ncbi:MAG: DUF3141 domain-containing protein [Azonexus sp.]|uniref:DUF3141 domain-containing protein n=1 Tax=Azonexus sp. TaxID=1872668 RepID=UPI00282A6A79|nr:DUF3141 domain-containing protein [Azonexus sp.]MDR0776300.1 DUF3141 domain-containing protein [Azonexus sp.]
MATKASKSSPKAPPSTAPAVADSNPAQAWGPFAEYLVDITQRSILFMDVLRQRSDQYYVQKAKKAPNVLSFAAEPVLDGRTLPRPVNYGIAHIKPPAGVVIDERKRPFVVVDPRAGQGPGIGGFKADSEIGVALRAGHPCYLIGFSAEPVPGQTLEDIMRAEAAFLEKVIANHPKADGKPCIIGNCQAGWAVMMMAATRPELCGPIIIAGAPLSYWAGEVGKNPMRYAGGLAGGSWMTALASDLGNGKFTGEYLVKNFENLNPANTLWSKNYDIWANVDQRAQRFLDFEKWWNTCINLNGEEIQWIVDKLFVGNRLATAEITTSDGTRIDLRNIRSPIICFCSKGDNITPPQQALGWITDLYSKDDDIRAADQTIIYMVHDSVGHLGIFVSGGVARKEHREFASNIDLIDVLPPGLYQAVLTPKTADTANPELVTGDWVVRFEPRQLDDVRQIVKPDPENERRFATVRRVSEINLGLYRAVLQPFVRAIASTGMLEPLKKLDPDELLFEFFSDRNPIMQQLARLSEQVRIQRHPVPGDNPMLQWQTAFSDSIVAALDNWRNLRDHGMEQLFLATYSSPLLQALVGLKGSDKPLRRRPGTDPERLAFIQQRIGEIRANIAKGGAREALIRSVVYICMAGTGVDERAFNLVEKIRAEHQGMTLQEFKLALREQFGGLLLDQDAALKAIPAMLPAEPAARKKLLEAVHRIVSAAGEVTGESAKRLAAIDLLFASPPPAKAA